MMISSIKAKKILSKRCMVYLVYVVQKSTKIVLDIKDTLMIQESLNVFSNSLLGLAPKGDRV